MGAGEAGPGKAGTERGQAQGQGTHIPCLPVTSQAKGHWTTRVCFCHKRDRGSLSRPLTLQARPGAGTPGERQAWGTSPHPWGASPPLSGQHGRDLTFSFSQAPETPRLR